MKKNILILCAFLTFLSSCSNSDKELLDKLQTAVKADSKGATGYHVVRLGDITNFEWDVMYYFAGGVGPEQIADEIGIKWKGSEVPEGHDRLLFVHNNQVVNFVDYKLEEFPLQVFGCNTDRWVYPKSRSTFATFNFCLSDKEVYAFIPEPCVENLKELMQNKCPDTSAKN